MRPLVVELGLEVAPEAWHAEHLEAAGLGDRSSCQLSQTYIAGLKGCIWSLELNTQANPAVGHCPLSLTVTATILKAGPVDIPSEEEG